MKCKHCGQIHSMVANFCRNTGKNLRSPGVKKAIKILMPEGAGDMLNELLDELKESCDNTNHQKARVKGFLHCPWCGKKI